MRNTSAVVKCTMKDAVLPQYYTTIKEIADVSVSEDVRKPMEILMLSCSVMLSKKAYFRPNPCRVLIS
jgi:hypothetical protein